MFRMWLLLVVVMLGLIGAYFFPQQIGSWSLSPVDLLSEFRVPDAEEQQLEDEDWEDDLADETPGDSLPSRASSPEGSEEEAEQIRSERDATRMAQLSAHGDSTFIPFEDYHAERRGLGHFYSALRRGADLGRPVRIAFMGDSFIEGDILTDALRAGLQQRWGGGGIGWMPLTSEVSKFRTSIRHDFGGWDDLSLLKSTKHRCPLSMHAYRSGASAWVRYRSVSGRALGEVTLYYSAREPQQIHIEQADTAYTLSLEATSEGAMASQRLDLSATASLRAQLSGSGLISYGVAMEQAVGVSLDNMSVRGNSGLLALSMDEAVSQEFARLRPYDLIVLQYGLNVASEQQASYGSYAGQMRKVIRRLRALYPGTDILLLGVSDRAQRSAGSLVTMKSIERLHAAQRRLAREEGVAFWSTLEAMRTLGGVVGMAERGWAAKDYTHMTHSGGRQLAAKLLEAFDMEKNYYDAAGV